MTGKKITIVFLPEEATKVRQFKIPRSLFFLFFFFCLAAAVGIAWGVRDYQAIKKEIPRLGRLQKENRQQKAQLATLAQRIDQISRRLIDLKKFDNKLKVMVNLEPNDDSTQFLGIGGSDPAILNPDYAIEKAHKKLVRLMHRSVENLNAEITVQTTEKAELISFLETQKSLLAHTPSVWPTRGWISSGFGYRVSPFTNQKEFHRGLDISTRSSTPIIAPSDGIVTSAGVDYGYGNILSVSHGHGLITKYAHMAKILVKKGQSVKRGSVIGLVGMTGRTTGPHLHYEVHLNGVPVDPLRYVLN
ncbi:MAG: M23 family metallopeptidase [Pseudomonadota bacterium]